MEITKSILIEEKVHYKLKHLAFVRNKKIKSLLEELILEEYKNEPQCNTNKN